jgi:hypothetical protein
MTRPSKFLGTLLGEWHKDHYVAAVIDDLHEAEQAVRDLELAGWRPGKVQLVQGKPAARHIEQIEDQRKPSTNVTAAVRGATSEKGPISQLYEAEAEQGHHILAVYTDGAEQGERARAILTRHQAHALEYFGRWVITDLPQQEQEHLPPKA